MAGFEDAPTIKVLLVGPEACDACAPKWVFRQIGETIQYCERHLDVMRRAIEVERTTIAERIAPVMRPVPMRRFQDSDLVGHAEPAAPVSGKVTTEFRMHGLGGEVVTASLHGSRSIDDVIESLRDALVCAEAKRDQPKPDYPVWPTLANPSQTIAKAARPGDANERPAERKR